MISPNLFEEQNALKLSMLVDYMKVKGWHSGVQLLSKAVVKAFDEPEYFEKLQILFDEYSTVRGREVFNGLGRSSLHHDNAVDAIDSAFCHVWNMENSKEYKKEFLGLNDND